MHTNKTSLYTTADADGYPPRVNSDARTTRIGILALAHRIKRWRYWNALLLFLCSLGFAVVGTFARREDDTEIRPAFKICFQVFTILTAFWSGFIIGDNTESTDQIRAPSNEFTQNSTLPVPLNRT